ncbi:hypothetical protein RIF25_11855 [Thermosynechococcaceae cyanobacterium BACA0444]|uniref:Uncharacterized protein n=1 Tax=Pseudocalidococcus azoricus BACA0444 TaxID=2918990 RepID=A0AAE4FUX9_9CYAN|nr:hypothetical protein [Pseudocalidococcus azoricus]MDS3861501.1 hypothetical protein [Pseudocalidococcus azoricus BACA0444]
MGLKVINRTYERLMAILASANLLLVLFNLSYVPWRDFWLQGRVSIPLVNRVLYIPMPLDITKFYDPIKGIEPHRDTQAYLELVDQLEASIERTGYSSPATESILAALRAGSIEMVDTNPFAIANKSGSLERIKNQMRLRVFSTKRNVSSKAAFEQFWSDRYINSVTGATNLAWFNRTIRPLMAANYYRGIGEDGEYIDNFGVLDIPFGLIFCLEFFARTFWMSRHQARLRWFDAMIIRWYDGLLFFPFWWIAPGWAWLRIIPVEIRLDQAQIISLQRIRKQASQGIVATIADDVTEVVVIQVLSQMQAAIRRGQFMRFLPSQGAQSGQQPLHPGNEIDELGEMAALVLQVTLKKVLPQLRPELEKLIQYNVDQALRQAPPYRQLANFPGLQTIPQQWSAQLASEITNRVYQVLTRLESEDKTAALLTSQLVQKFGTTLSYELQQQQVGQALRDLLIDWLEEVKASFMAQKRQARLPESNTP